MLTISNLSVSFPFQDQKWVNAVRNADLHVKPSESITIIGESGSGKSVLSLAILSLLPNSVRIIGDIRFQGKPLLNLDEKSLQKIRGEQIALIPQGTGLSLNPTMRVGKQIEEIFTEKQYQKKHTSRKLTRQLLAGFGLSSCVTRLYPHQLSGGMKQRTLASMGIASRPKVLIADEPTKGIDSQRKKEVTEVFRTLKAENPNMSMLIITHDLDFAKNIGERVAVMYCGSIVEITQSSQFFEKPLHPYSQGLLESSPLRTLKPISGDIPSMSSIPCGCPFSPRCPNAIQWCFNQIPPLISLDSNHVRCWQYDCSQ